MPSATSGWRRSATSASARSSSTGQRSRPAGHPARSSSSSRSPKGAPAGKNRLHVDIEVGDDIARRVRAARGTRRDTPERDDRRGRHRLDRDGRYRGQRVLSRPPLTCLPPSRRRSTTCGRRPAPTARRVPATCSSRCSATRCCRTATTPQISVRALSRLLAAFGVNERLVRTSLTRLVNDGLADDDQRGPTQLLPRRAGGARPVPPGRPSDLPRHRPTSGTGRGRSSSSTAPRRRRAAAPHSARSWRGPDSASWRPT